MTQQRLNKGLRWWVLIVAVINPFFSYLADALGITPRSIAEVSLQYNNYFMPAGYAFSIWGLIYLSFIVYAIYQILPAQQKDSLYDKLAIPFITANILGMIWQVLFTRHMLSLASVFIIIMLLLSGIMFRRVKLALRSEAYSDWLSFPFSLYMGWLSVANIANAAVWLVYMGWHGSPLGEQHWAIVMIIMATLLAVLISFRFSDGIYPLVVGWALGAIYVANQYTSNTVAADALLATAAIFIYTVSFYIWSYLHQTEKRHGSLRKHNKALKH